jgi:hypothetical protein
VLVAFLTAAARASSAPCGPVRAADEELYAAKAAGRDRAGVRAVGAGVPAPTG